MRSRSWSGGMRAARRANRMTRWAWTAKRSASTCAPPRRPGSFPAGRRRATSIGPQWCGGGSPGWPAPGCGRWPGPQIAVHHGCMKANLPLVTLATIRQRLRGEHGLNVSVASLRRYVRANLSEEVRRSRRMFVRPVLLMDQRSWAEADMEAFACFGGVPRRPDARQPVGHSPRSVDITDTGSRGFRGRDGTGGTQILLSGVPC